MKIELKDFQAHANSVLDLRGGLVCVVGKTNAGKSSIIRALRSLVYDSIRGSRFVRNGQQEATIQVQFDDVAVAKIKGKKINRYIVGGEKYDAIGVGIPVEAAKALNMPLVQVDKDLNVELHVASQLNPPFLILDNDSTRAKFLNVLTGGNLLDAALRETNRKVLEVTRAKAEIQTRLDEDKERVRVFDDIPAKELALDALKDQLERLETLESTVERLTAIKAALDYVKAKKQRVDEGLAVLARYDWAWALQRLIVIEQILECVGKLSRIRSVEKPVLDRKLEVLGRGDWTGAVSRLSIIQQTTDSLTALSNVRSYIHVLDRQLKVLQLHDWSQLLTRLNRAVDIANLVDNTRRIINSLQPILRKLAFVSGIDCVLALNRLSTISSVMEIGERLRSVRLGFGMINGKEATLDVELAVVREKFLQLPDQSCETCGRPIDKATREQHLKEVANAG